MQRDGRDALFQLQRTVDHTKQAVGSTNVQEPIGGKRFGRSTFRHKNRSLFHEMLLHH